MYVCVHMYVCIYVYTCVWGKRSGRVISRQPKEIKTAVFIKRLGPPLWRLHVPKDRAKQAKREYLKSAVTAWLSK